MPKIIQLSTHVANLIAAGEVVERPASVVKELLENAVDAGATKITVEIRDGGMTFLRLTDNGCGMEPLDARTAFLRHATSKLRTAEDLAAITTCGFRGEALAAIASVSRIDLLTKTADNLTGVSLHLEAGNITEETEAGCPDGTTIIVRDLFFNTPARMKFMKADSVEASRVAAAVQLQALAHPEVAITFIKDGKQALSTPGTGGLEAAVYCVYGRECAKMIKVDSRWEQYRLTGYISKPTDSRPSRNLQTFFVNDRPVKSRLLVAALEEAYRNQIMVGKFPACVLHLTLPANALDVNVHPAKTEVKFLQEKAVFDCIHYGVLGTLNKTPDRPQVQFKKEPVVTAPSSPPAFTRVAERMGSTVAGGDCSIKIVPETKQGRGEPGVAIPPDNRSLRTSSQAGVAIPSPKENFFRTMNPEEYKAFTTALTEAPQPKPQAAAATAAKVERIRPPVVRDTVLTPRVEPAPVMPPVILVAPPEPSPEEEPEQAVLPMPEEIPWRMVGELYSSYILVEQGEDAFLIDKHAAHERILFDKLKENQEAISSQALLTPISVRLSPAAAGELLANKALLEELGFELEEFGENTLLLRQIPMDLSPQDAADAVETIAADLLSGKKEDKRNVRDEVLHSVACKAAIKAGWKNDEAELLALVKQVMAREDLKYCPHGRPICITLSKKQLEKQFKRS